MEGAYVLSLRPSGHGAVPLAIDHAPMLARDGFDDRLILRHRQGVLESDVSRGPAGHRPQHPSDWTWCVAVDVAADADGTGARDHRFDFGPR